MVDKAFWIVYNSKCKEIYKQKKQKGNKRMETRNFMIMYKLGNNSVWHTEYFITEQLARDAANKLFREGYVYIELLKKVRSGGYSTVKKVVQNEIVAKAKHDAFVKETEQKALSYHKQLFG